MLAGGTTAKWVAFFRRHDVPRARDRAPSMDLVDRLPEADHPHAGR